MGCYEAWTVASCAVVFAGIGVAVVLSAGLAAPCGLAMFAVVEGTTTLTAAGCTAVAAGGCAGAGVGAHFGNAVNHVKKE